MSFLTLFTATAAAAHDHEFSPPSPPSSTPIPCALQMRDSNAQTHRLSAINSPTPATVFEDIIATPPPPPKKLQRSKTFYHLAQPPPGSHHHFKPTRSLVVQLQKLSNITRPLPTLDVLPASVFAPRLKRKLGKFFKNGVGTQDLVFLTSEDFGDDDDEDDEESLNSRHVVASVSIGYKKINGEEGKGSKTTIIRLDSGPQWEVSQNNVGGYEFVAYEDDGNVLMARWNPKSATPRRRSYQTTMSDNGDEERKFQFSLVNPNSKKHPILGSLTKQTIGINDQYPLPSLSSPLASPTTTPPQSRPGSPVSMSPLGVAFQMAEEKIMVKTSEHMRTLILVSGIWVALREGLVTSNMRLDEPLSPTCPLSPTSSLFPNGRLSPTYVRPSIAGRSASDPAGKRVFEDKPLRRPTRAGTLLAHNATTNSHRHSAPESSEFSRPRRANSLGVSPRSSVFSGTIRSLGRSSPVPESKVTTRSNTPELQKPVPTTRMPVPPTTPPAVGCIQRRFAGHRHTNSVSLPNSPSKHREKQKAVLVASPVEELRKHEREKRRWSKRLSGLVDMLRRATP